MSKLRPAERVGLELDRLERIWRRLGPERGEQALGAAMEDLAVLLCDAAAAWKLADLATLRLRSLGVQGLADRLGLPLLARVASDVVAMCDGSDDAALAATAARLSRVGEQSLFAIWDAQVPVG